jgi:hypothetical protein
VESYSFGDYQAQLSAWNDRYSPGEGIGAAYSAMMGVIEDLKHSRTIEYCKDGRKIVYGSGGADEMNAYDLPADPLMLVGGPGSDLQVGRQDSILAAG